MPKNFKYSVNLLQFNPDLLTRAFDCSMVFPFGYQEVEFRTIEADDGCVFCGEPRRRDVCSCPEYLRVENWLKRRYADSKLVITKFEVLQVSAGPNFCCSQLVEREEDRVANPMKVKVGDFDFCTRIDDQKAAGAIMLSRAWLQMDQICFLSHREGRDGVNLIRVNVSDISGRYPVYHVEWRTSRATFEMDVERHITPDILIQKLSAVRLPR